MTEKEDKLYAMRHSLAHIMASAIQHLWPQVKFGVGPVIEDGFYYDVDFSGVEFSDNDFKKIEAEMRLIIKADLPFELIKMSINDAVEWATKANQPYKLELLHDLRRAGTTFLKDIDDSELGLKSDSDKVKDVTFYKSGDLVDLCRGPHVESTGKVGAFKLTKTAGAYWRGKDTNPQMQRIYGLAFANR